MGRVSFHRLVMIKSLSEVSLASYSFVLAAAMATPAPVGLPGNNHHLFFPPTSCIAGVFSMFGLAGSVPVPVGRSLNLARF